MQYKFKTNNDITTILDKDNNIVARYQLSYKWNEVNYSYKDDGIHIRLFDKYKKYKDVIIKLGLDEIQQIK